MSASEGYEYRARKTGEVAIFHGDKLAKLLRGDDAAAFLKDVKARDPQEAMADAVGGEKSSADRSQVGDATTAGKGQKAGGQAHAHSEFRRRGGAA